jgi:hypothetical protein
MSSRTRREECARDLSPATKTRASAVVADDAENLALPDLKADVAQGPDVVRGRG